MDNISDLIYFTQYTDVNGDHIIHSETVMRVRKDGTLDLYETAALGPAMQEYRRKDAQFAKLHLGNLVDQFGGAGPAVEGQKLTAGMCLK